jgi:hypothetical protein
VILARREAQQLARVRLDDRIADAKCGLAGENQVELGLGMKMTRSTLSANSAPTSADIDWIKVYDWQR